MWHSITDLKIYRTSNGNRYNESITPAMTDKVVDVPGGDGQYYFGTTFKNRTFTVDYAFDKLTKTEIDTIKMVFSGDGIHELVFDEDRDNNGTAIKIWSAKVTGTATMKHLCFEENGVDTYKGEGSITFTCYYPYARSEKLKLSTENTAETRLPTNNGDIPAPFKFTIKRWNNVNNTHSDDYDIDDSQKIWGIEYSDGTGGEDTIDLVFLSPQSATDSEYTWDSKTGLITKTDTDSTTVIPYTGNGIKKIPAGGRIGKMYFLVGDETGQTGEKFAYRDPDKSEFRELYR